MDVNELVEGNDAEDNPIIGYYKNGDPIRKDPSTREIEDHIEEWYDLMKRIMSAEQREVFDAVRTARLSRTFVEQCRKLTDEQIIDSAIKFWSRCWPWEVQPFMQQIKDVRERLFDPRGFAAGDKDKSMVMYGAIPDRVKSLCMSVRVDFFRRDSRGRSKNIELFYKICPAAKISSFKGSA